MTNIDWADVLAAARNDQPKIIQNVKTFELCAMSPLKCHFTGKEIAGSHFIVLYTERRQALALVVESTFYMRNIIAIKNYLSITQPMVSDAMALKIVDSIPQFANYKVWFTPSLIPVTGSWKDVDQVGSSTLDNTRIAGRENVDPDFMENAQLETANRIEQLDYNPSVSEALSLLDDIQVALPVRKEPMLLEVKHE